MCRTYNKISKQYSTKKTQTLNTKSSSKLPLPHEQRNKADTDKELNLINKCGIVDMCIILEIHHWEIWVDMLAYCFTAFDIKACYPPPLQACLILSFILANSTSKGEPDRFNNFDLKPWLMLSPFQSLWRSKGIFILTWSRDRNYT